MPKSLQVVDANVAIIANKRDGGTYACASACAEALMELRRTGKIVLDEDNLILDEYKKYLKYKGMPGAGDAFIKWLFNNRHKSSLCSLVKITSIDVGWRRFEEFPDDVKLSTFDPSDQKFIAVAK